MLQRQVAQVQMNDVKWREPKNLCQIPQSSPVSKSETTPHASSSHSRATAATGRGTSTGAAAAESPAELGARPQRTRTAGLRSVANQPEEICCTRSLVTPQKKMKRVKRTYFMLFFYLFGSCKRLTPSIQNSGSLWVNWEALPKQQWLERNKRNLIHPWRQTATVEIV